MVRVSDIIAYVGKDRQDAKLAKIIESEDIFTDKGAGKISATMINNFSTDIINNSYGKPYIKMSDEMFEAFALAKKENYDLIYKNEGVDRTYKTDIMPMFRQMYEKLLDELNSGQRDSVIYKHHIDYVSEYRSYYCDDVYENEDANDIVVDYIASMTDDYFIDLYEKMFPDNKRKINYISYFDDLNA